MTIDAPALAPRGVRTRTPSEISPRRCIMRDTKIPIDITLFDDAGVKLERQSGLTESARAGNS